MSKADDFRRFEWHRFVGLENEFSDKLLHGSVCGPWLISRLYPLDESSGAVIQLAVLGRVVGSCGAEVLDNWQNIVHFLQHCWFRRPS